MTEGGDIVATDASPAGDALLEDWPLRPWLLAGLGAFAGFLIWFLLDDWADESPARMAGAAFIFFASASTAFTLTLRRPLEAVVFSLAVGAVMGGVAFLVLDAGERLAGEEYALGAGVFFSLLAIPLFQAGFHRTRFATPYETTHFHVWTDAVSAGGAIAFTILSWAVLWLLHALFSLIGIEVIEQLIQQGWFPAVFIGATFGGAMGVLRNQLGIIGTLQRVVMLVFSLLSVPFAVALMIFLVILLFSGGNALWNATDSATPVLLSCAVGAFILCNAVVRDDDEARSANVVMQAAAIALAFAILPLTVFAAISMGIRVDQHGLAPARIWGLIAVVIACAYGVAYWAGLARGRMAAWSHYLRRANLHLAAITCVVALVLAIPVMDFGAISTRDQLARLESGEVTPDEFDFAALRWDFGDAGREALAELEQSEDTQVAQLAQDAQAMERRPYDGRTLADRREIAENIQFGDMDEATQQAVQAYVRGEIYLCDDGCRAVELSETESGSLIVLLVAQRWVGPKLLLVAPGSEKAVEQIVSNGALVESASGLDRPSDDEDSLAGKVELRPFEGQQLYIDGERASQPFE